ncbi:MAG: hypothetical protein JJV88_05860 [Sulfurovum sp.]|nr:hypothetical protein [Sulfurovaceae bacterium]
MQFRAINIPCESCGAYMVFSPKEGELHCDFCNSTADIPMGRGVFSEDYNSAVHSHPMLYEDDNQNKIIIKEVTCKKCNARFKLAPQRFSDLCPYCQTPVIIDCIQDITPHGILPFLITQKEAQDRFKIWVGSRWFAPDAFKQYLDESKKLIGYYFPFWSYDTRTITNYQGQRGDAYFVTVNQTVIVNGKKESRRVQERRIKWSHASGMVEVSFDDLTVGASNTIIRKRLDEIEPWYCDEVQEFNIKYISGFIAEEYTLELDDGFEIAKDKMYPIIKREVELDIGGDEQIIDNMQTQYHNIGYKNLLFPVWTASFYYERKDYYYAINARNGKIVGDRPYSYIKITFAIIGVLVILGIIYYLTKQP